MKTTIWTQIIREIKRLRSGYRPERHYMRGPRRTDSPPQQPKMRAVPQKRPQQHSDHHPVTACAGK
jgi:hypothetical protein